jgi:hypothetical protein
MYFLTALWELISEINRKRKAGNTKQRGSGSDGTNEFDEVQELNCAANYGASVSTEANTHAR